VRETAARDCRTIVALRLNPSVAAPRGAPASRACCAASYRLWCCHQRHMRTAITATMTKQKNSASCEGGARSPLAAASCSKTAFAWGMACCCVTQEIKDVSGGGGLFEAG
jgi:hypothetical protein